MVPSEPRRAFALQVFVTSAVLVMGLDLIGPFPRLFLLKGLPVWALSVWLLNTVPLPKSRWMLAALLWGSAGDVVLAAAALAHPVGLFLGGMGLFLVGHGCYIVAFAPEFRFRPSRLVPAGMIAGVALVVGALLFVKLGPSSVPILVYAGALSTMGIAAAFRGSERKTVLYGALLFVLSDGIVAAARFAGPVPLAPLWIFPTYFGAQYLLSAGWARDQLTPGTPAPRVVASA